MEKILTNMVDLLEEYDYNYSTCALNKIIDTWHDRKRFLIEAFEEHPNYIGEYMIAFDTNYEREIDQVIVRGFIDWIRYSCITNPTHMMTLPQEVTSFEYLYNIKYEVYCILDTYSNWYTRTISEEFAKKINSAMPNIHAHAGQKASRVMNKICNYLGYSKHLEYNKEYAKFADALSPIKIKRHTILSLNPIDYLTMSFGNSWASCHTIDKTNKRGMPNSYEGQYSSGTMSYMLDKVSMVLYTVDASYEGKEYYTQPKIHRQMFHFGEEKLIQGRLYPQSHDAYSEELYTNYRNIVQEIISCIMDVPNLWTISHKAAAYTYSEGTHYRDYECYSPCTMSRLKGTENEEQIIIGADPICIECGYTHEVEENINCCSRQTYCEHCGCVVHPDDVIWVDGYPYCRECVEYCDRCECYHRTDSTYIPSEDRNVCRYCLDNYYYYCDECNEYCYYDDVHYIDSTDRYVCDDCLEEYYTQCVECDEYFLNDHIDECGRCESCRNEEE